MTARADEVVRRVAEALSFEVIGDPGGGEFGAALVRDERGEVRILKAVTGAHRAPAWARGSALADRLNRQGYPAPRYFGTGVVVDAVWSLQEVLPGEVPSPATATQVRQLHQLAERHADNAGGLAGTGIAEPRVGLTIETARRLQVESRTRDFGSDVTRALERLATTPIPDGDICHGDFHHRNFLATGDQVTGVFDWESAGCGDWRFDVVTLAFWASVSTAVAASQEGPPQQFELDAAHLAAAHAAAVCDSATLALYGAALSTRVVAFNAAWHPDWLDSILAAIESDIAPWWRD